MLLGLPFAWLGYPDAHLVWNLLSLVMFGAAVVLVIRELGVPIRPLSVLPLVALTMLCHPLYNQLSHGQLNALLALLVVLAWVADRRGRAGWAGALVGAAAAVKLSPAFLFLYFVCTRQWRAVVTGGLVFTALNLLAAGALGLDAYRDYVRVVIPSVTGKYQTFFANVSLAGFWLRVFAPDPRHAEPLVYAPLLGHLIANGLRLAVVLAVARVCWRAATRDARDRALAVAVVATALVSPLSWNHGYLLFVLPLGLVWMRLPAGWLRWALSAVLALMWAPELTVSFLTLGQDRVFDIISPVPSPITAAENLFAVAVPHYALVGFFLLALLVPAERPPAGR